MTEHPFFSRAREKYTRPPIAGALNVALVAGPMYDPLYELLPEFERQSGRRVHVAARLVHPELNAHLEAAYRAGAGAYDLISTHSKYMPSQKYFLQRSTIGFAIRNWTTSFPRSSKRAGSTGGCWVCRATSTFASCTIAGI